MPAMILQQLHATASLRYYDYIFKKESMKTVELWRRAYNLFHGNQDLNILSQVNLVVNGHGYYTRIYDAEVNVVTNRNTASIDNLSIGDSSNNSNQLVMRTLFNPNDNAFRFTSGVHFTSETVAASSKSSIEKCTGRTIIDLGKTVL